MDESEILEIVQEKEKNILIENLKKEKQKNMELQDQLNAILNSRSYKFIQKIKKILRRG